jgi:serine/threonine-protein kinase
VSGALGFSKIVAIKRILPHLLGQQEFLEMFVDETRLAARIQHPNVVSTLDAVVTQEEVFLVMEYVLGEPASRLLREARTRGEPMPVRIAVSIVCGALRGLHAAHEARSDTGELLGVVHRDVSPQNILVGVDGVTRVIDFGIAKARGRLQTTREGEIKGKLAYMSPEQLTGLEPDRRTDVHAMGVILWEALTGRRLYSGDNDAIIYANVLHSVVEPPSRVAAHVPPALDPVVMRAIARNPADRFATAEDMVIALEAAVQPASPNVVRDWVRSLTGDLIAAKATRIAEIERALHLPPSERSAIRESPSLRSAEASGSLSREHNGAPSVGSDVLTVGYGRSTSYELRSQPSSAKITAILVAMIAVSVMGVVLIVVSVRRPVRTASAANATTSSPAASTPAAGAPAPSISTTASVDEPRKPAPALASAPASSSVAKVKATPPRVVPPRAPKPTCDPPWFIDPKGIKRFKPECM